MKRLCGVGLAAILLVLLAGGTSAAPGSGRPAAIERLYVKGLRHFVAGDFAKAVLPLKKALRRGRWTDIRVLLARAYVQLGSCAEIDPLLDGIDVGELALEQRRYALDFLTKAREHCAAAAAPPAASPTVDPKPGMKLPLILPPPGEAPMARIIGVPGPEGMVRVGGGSFRLGNPRGARDERPARRVVVSAFLLGQTEVSIADFIRCVDNGACDLSQVTTHAQRPACTLGKPGFERYPVDCVSWEGAKAFCAWQGARLPTEAEWELAARGRKGRLYPWGSEVPNCARCGVGGHSCGPSRAAVGSRPEGASPEDVQDLCGNVMEWVADWYAAGAYREAARRDPVGPTEGARRVVRGGVRGRRGWLDTAAPADLESSVRWALSPDSREPGVGFRCARDVE